MEEKAKRIEYIDLLRILSALAVVFLHVSAQNWSIFKVETLAWDICNLYDSLVRWAVPVFVMISGTLLLSKEYKLKDLYFRKILRIITAFIFWSFIYVLLFHQDLSKMQMIQNFLIGHHHMWFLFMICGLYMLVPFLKKISSSKKLTEYYIILSIIFTGILPLISNILLDFNFFYIGNAINYNLSKVGLLFGYTGYFLLGYYLKENDISKNKRKIIYILGIFGYIFTTLMTRITSLRYGRANIAYYNELYLNVFLEAIAVFVFAKYNFKTNKIINGIAKCCFGIYLVHVIFLNKLAEFGLNTGSFNALISIPAISILVFVLSLLSSWIINKIPILKKYIV